MLKFVVFARRKIAKIFNIINIEISTHKFLYIFLISILLLALYLRVYRLDEILMFHFDQGRDAKEVWEFITGRREPYLIGPTTGLAGVFRGPYYYYLITPFYFLGGGNPVWPAVFLAISTVVAITLGYFIGYKIQDRATGIIFAVLSSFSFYIVMASRWLSNPTPMLLLSLILYFSMIKILENSRKNAGKWWIVVAFISGLSLFNFGSSGELYYLVSIFIFTVWQWRKIPNLKFILLSGFAFFVTFAPLLFFDLKHDGILRQGLSQNFGQEKSFTLPYLSLFESRNQFYANLFPKLIFHSLGNNEKVALTILSVFFFAFVYRFYKNEKIRLLLLLLVSPAIGLYFYQGNYKVLYDYYMTGYFLLFIMIVAVTLGQVWKYKIGKIFVFIFLSMFIVNNAEFIEFKLSDKSDNPESISYVNQKQVIDWIYTNANGEDFNVDVYVPPVIPHSYDYLFDWYGGKIHGAKPKDYSVKLLYTLYEVDPPHPERLDAWLGRQVGIGKVMETYKSGGITVEKRERI